MRLRKWILPALVSAGVFTTSMGCKPRTPAQKVEDKVEDAGHEVHQGMERAKENVEDATKK